MPTKTGFQLTKRDIEILQHVYDFHLVHFEHLRALTGRSERTLYRRLQKLTDSKYLYRKRHMIERHLPLAYQKFVYTLNRGAVPVLVEQGIGTPEDVDLLQRRLREIKELFLKHALFLTDVHVVLELISRIRPIKLMRWHEGKELYDSVSVTEDGKQVKLPVRPDAFFTLDDNGRLRHFFLEVDRGTTTTKRFQRKIKAYSAYFQNGLQEKKYGIRQARIVTLTVSEARAKNLAKAATEILTKGEGKFYYFAPANHFSLERPLDALGEIFMAPYVYVLDARFSLLPPLSGRA